MNYVVAVRALCEFTARRGDLDLRFTPAPSASEGMAGHVTVAARRAAGYETEIALSGRHADLTVRGRADGYAASENRLEEIKTHRGDVDAIPANHRTLHWAQALVYGHLLCEARGLDELIVSLVYFEVDSEKETTLEQPHTAESLAAFFMEQCERFIDWAHHEDAHRRKRDAALQAMTFPHGVFRSGQRELAVAVYRAARDGANLMAQAPTGIGKTIATLFPVLKACAQGHIDRIFFLTAKTPGRTLAIDAIETLRTGFASDSSAVESGNKSDNESATQSGTGSDTGSGAKRLPLRVLELVARDKACEHPDKACHGDACPLARGFYDRLDAARGEALGPASHDAASTVSDAAGDNVPPVLMLDRAAVRKAALRHDICPYYLAQELARWSDVVIGDYNYYYDNNGLLFALTQLHQWRVAVLVDEAHNLLDRARKMFSASLEQSALRQTRASAPKFLKKPIDRLNRAWNALNRVQQSDYQVHERIPPPILSAAQNLVSILTEHLARVPLAIPPAEMRFYFDAMRFASLAEQFGTHSIFDAALMPGHGADANTPGTTALTVRNVIPAPFLKTRFTAARTTILFSGTLQPAHFYRDMLGLSPSTPVLDVEGPFRAEQLQVCVARHISTRWRDRERSLAPIVDLIARQYASRPGNYLGFFSSFDYLQRVVALLAELHPSVPIWMQSPAMDEAARDRFLARFEHGGTGVGFAVLGGAFSEGVDLPGERLIGAFIATLGLPQMNAVNEQMRHTMNATFGNGYDYTYLYPGLQKVVQAAGRVIRTENDAGVLHLIDDRYRQSEVRRLLPGWWHVPD